MHDTEIAASRILPVANSSTRNARNLNGCVGACALEKSRLCTMRICTPYCSLVRTCSGKIHYDMQVISNYIQIYIYADPLLILRCLFQKSPKEIVGQAAETTWYRQRPQHSLPLAHRTNEKRTLAVGIGTASKISTVDRTQSTLATHWQHTGNTLANLVLIEKSRDITVLHGNHHDISGLLKSFSYKLWAHAGRGTYLSQTSHLAGPADSP